MLGAVVLFSTVEIAGKVIGPRVDPVVLTFLRFALTGGLLLAYASARPGPRPGFGRGDYALFALNGFVGIALAITLFHAAILVFEKAASAAVVFCVNPVFAVVFGRFINGEAWTARKWGAVALGTAGIFCFAFETGRFAASSLAGLALMFLAAMLFALSVCIAKRALPRYDPLRLMAWSALFGCLPLAPWAAVRCARAGLAGLANAWVLVLYVALAGTALAYALYYTGLARLSVHAGSAVFFLKPALATLLAALLLGERINAYMLLGTALVLGGLIGAIRSPPERGAARGQQAEGKA